MDVIRKFEPIFGVWHAESLIGAGSFGRVYKIYREELGHRYYSALKYISLPSDRSEIDQLLTSGMEEDSVTAYYGDMAKDIAAEAAVMDTLRGNPNIVGFDDSRVVPKKDGIGYDIFIRMELLKSLTARLLERPLSRKEIIDLGIDISNALSFCEKRGVIHRDIKPDNIFISENGDFKLGDFGIARQLEKTTAFMSKKGTYNYMAPEVFRGDQYGSNCDIYSLGIVLYRLLNNGRLPFLPPAPQVITPGLQEEALAKRFTGAALPYPCNAQDALGAIVLKACAFDPKQRYASAAEMKEALLDLRAEEQHPADGYSAAPKPAEAEPTVSVSSLPPLYSDGTVSVRPLGFPDGSAGASYAQQETVAVHSAGKPVSRADEDSDEYEKPDRLRGLKIAAGIVFAILAVLFVLYVNGVL